LSILNTRDGNSASGSGHSKVHDYGENVKLPEFLPLSNPVEQGWVLDFAERAAQEDVESGALDKYLFSGDGFETPEGYETQFEKSLPYIFAILKDRVSSWGARDLLVSQNRLDELENEKSAAELDLAHQQGIAELEKDRENAFAKQKLEQLREKYEDSLVQLGVAEGILSGETPAKDGLFWPGLITRLKSKWPALTVFWSNFKYMSVLFLVAVVDSVIVVTSIWNIMGDNEIWGPLFFALPAIALQVTFPHLIGKNYGRIMRSFEAREISGKTPDGQNETKYGEKNLESLIIVFVLSLIWLTFVGLLTAIRVDYVLASTGEERLGQIMMVFMPVVLLGLGLWIIILARNDNPYVRRHLTLQLRARRLEEQIADVSIMKVGNPFQRRRSIRAQKQSAKVINQLSEKVDMLVRQIETQQAANANLELEISKHETEVQFEFPKLAKIWYRRWLSNFMKDPEFTSRSTK
jgi:hypothetical protein